MEQTLPPTEPTSDFSNQNQTETAGAATIQYSPSKHNRFSSIGTSLQGTISLSLKAENGGDKTMYEYFGAGQEIDISETETMKTEQPTFESNNMDVTAG